jgi:hypothetical protein
MAKKKPKKFTQTQDYKNIKSAARRVPGYRTAASARKKIFSTPKKDRYAKKLKNTNKDLQTKLDTCNSTLQQSNSNYTKCDTEKTNISSNLLKAETDLNTCKIEKQTEIDRCSKFSATVQGFTTLNDSIYNIEPFPLNEGMTGMTIKLEGGCVPVSNALQSSYNKSQENNSYIRRTSMTDMAYKFLTVKQENELLDNEIENTINKYSTDNKKVEIRTTDITNIKAYRVVAFVIYYICVALFSFMLITASSLGTALKVILILLAAAYPFYVNILAQALTYIYRYVYAMTMGIKYKPT